MTRDAPSPIRPTDDEARAIVRDVVTKARIAALAVTDPDSGAPHVTRIGFGRAHDGTWLTLISSLANHTRALHQSPRAGLLLGDVPTKGDPLAFPRLSAAVSAEFIAPTDPRRAMFREAWLMHHPKSALYIDFADFSFVILTPLSADLNGGFGKAYHLTADDLT